MQHKVTFVLALVLVLALSTSAQTSAETCEVEGKKRTNCGYSGVTREECEKKGCCFNDRTFGVPWCFFPEPVEEECEF